MVQLPAGVVDGEAALLRLLLLLLHLLGWGVDVRGGCVNEREQARLLHSRGIPPSVQRLLLFGIALLPNALGDHHSGGRVEGTSLAVRKEE